MPGSERSRLGRDAGVWAAAYTIGGALVADFAVRVARRVDEMRREEAGAAAFRSVMNDG